MNPAQKGKGQVWNDNTGECVFTGSQLPFKYYSIFEEEIFSIRQQFDFQNRSEFGICIRGDSVYSYIHIPYFLNSKTNNTRAILVDHSQIHFLERRGCT